MSEVDSLFDQAYKLHVVDENHREAIVLCRRALAIEPNNYRIRVFLGMLLGDYGSPDEVDEARVHFLAAIKGAERVSMFCTDWPEEAAIHHLGVWEIARKHELAASLFFLIDYLVCGNDSSYRYLINILQDKNIELSQEIQSLLGRVRGMRAFASADAESSETD